MMDVIIKLLVYHPRHLTASGPLRTAVHRVKFKYNAAIIFLFITNDLNFYSATECLPRNVGMTARYYCVRNLAK